MRLQLDASDFVRELVARVMSATIKRGVLGLFCAAFAVYSVYVWTAATERPEARRPSRLTYAGLALFQEKNCIACHQLYGLGGHMGPDLTNVVSAPDKGADYARAFIAGGTDKMPDFKLSENEIEALVDFLRFVDSSGTFPPQQPEINWYGTVAYDADRRTE